MKAAATLLVVIAFGLGTARIQAQAPGTARVVPIQITGDPAARFVLVVLSDGYTAAELPKFREQLDKHLNIMWSLEPFRSYRNYINVYAVEIVSAESGITCDPAHREKRNTPLGLYFDRGCENPNARGVLIERTKQDTLRRYARLATPHYDQTLTIANTDTYGGIGGREATTTGANALSPYITPHEIGHSLGRLQDEYTYRERGVKGPQYMQGEPASHHHTLLTEAQMRAQQKKWWRWLGEESEAGGKIGRFEGGMYSVGGVWRPSRHSLMISLGYYFDQVSRERLTERISSQVELIAAATPGSEVDPRQIVWVEPAHPNYHELELSWQIDGKPVPAAANRASIDLSQHRVARGQVVAVKVVDPTPFVRDPLIRDTSFSATKTWTVGAGNRVPEAGALAIHGATDTARAVSGREVVYIETSYPFDHPLLVSWQLNGSVVPNATNARTFDLARQNLGTGRHTLSVTVRDPADPNSAPRTLRWTVDNVGPTVTYALSPAVSTTTERDGTPHYIMRDSFTMKLEPADDQPGYVVAEFRVNGDGWHHYYGWPDAPPGTPFLFTPRGTTIKELVYGSLSSEGLSPQPWETRAPGWGTHTIEYRARDAAGNTGEIRKFRVTIGASSR